ncbi:MAG: hypothetical protein EBV07_01150 [Proteobacteria bacterium]|nr:hypothetical protein [Pseudomonadota bacterium]
MKRLLYLDLTLPVFADKDLCERYSRFLKNTFRSLEKTSNIKLYFSMNLFNEIHLNSTFLEIIPILKSLVDSERAEIVLSASFNISNNSNQQAFIYDMLYSEYFNGYHLGMPRDFEGDECIMLKNYISYFLPRGQITSSLIDSMGLMGYRRLFVSKNLIDTPLIYSGIQLIPVQLNTSLLFKNYITSEVVNEFFQGDDSSVFYLNLFELFQDNPFNIETNLSSFLYLLDKSISGWDFLDIDDENMKFNENLPSNILERLSGNPELDDLDNIKQELVKYFSHKSLNNNDDFKRIPVWVNVEDREIALQNMFNLKIMSLLSSEVSRKNILLNPHLKDHVNDIIDMLVTSSYSNEDIKSLFSVFQDKINQK